MVAPLVANRHRYGLFVVLVERASPFVEDDLAVLEVLAEQAALAIDVRQLIEDNERERITLGAVMASMHDGLLVLDADNTVRYSNARADEFLGVASHALHGSDSE